MNTHPTEIHPLVLERLINRLADDFGWDTLSALLCVDENPRAQIERLIQFEANQEYVYEIKRKNNETVIVVYGFDGMPVFSGTAEQLLQQHSED